MNTRPLDELAPGEIRMLDSITIKTSAHTVSICAIQNDDGWVAAMLVHDPKSEQVNGHFIEPAHPIEDEEVARQLFPHLKSYRYNTDEPK